MRIFLLVATLVWGIPALADTATIVEGAPVKLRSGKYDTYRVVKALDPGTVVEILKQEKSYVQVKTNEGDVGWLPLRFVKMTVTPPPVPTEPPASSNIDAPQAEIAKAQAEIKPSRNAGYAASIWIVIGVGFAGLVLGSVLGIVGLLAYYRKKLNGLRI